MLRVLLLALAIVAVAAGPLKGTQSTCAAAPGRRLGSGDPYTDCQGGLDACCAQCQSDAKCKSFHCFQSGTESFQNQSLTNQSLTMHCKFRDNADDQGPAVGPGTNYY